MQCMWQTSFLWGAYEQCTEDATQILVIACEHEHIREHPSCDGCAETVQAKINGMHCGVCCGADVAQCDGSIVVAQKVIEIKAVA